jgi:hypothetical protein
MDDERDSLDVGWDTDRPLSAPPPKRAPRGKTVTSVYGWLTEVERQDAIYRPARAWYDRWRETIRWLTTQRIRACHHRPTLQRLDQFLRKHLYDRSPSGVGGQFSRAEIGELIAEAGNRVRTLECGRLAARPKGPAFDVVLIPDDRLEWLIQHHVDMAIVEACRAERVVRARARWTPPAHAGVCGRNIEAGPGSCSYWWKGCPSPERRGCYLHWAQQQPEWNPNHPVNAKHKEAA